MAPRLASGQAIVEWALFVPLFSFLFLAIDAFGQWFVIHQQLLAAAKQGAFLYSTGRLPTRQVKRVMQLSLRRSRPTLEVPLRNIQIARAPSFQARLYKLDQVKVIYQPASRILNLFFGNRPMEETCIIKHAPGYWRSSGLQVNPPVPW